MAERILVSPGVFTREFDGTIRPADTGPVGGALIAPRSKGPAMVPVKVKDRDEDEMFFGLPKSDGKDFGAYTARAYLDNQTNPITQIRVLGMSDTGVTPGFSIAGASANNLYAIGASGGFVVALIASSGTVSLAGTLTSSVDSLAVSIAGFGDVTASLNRNASNYIRKVLNEDPTQFSTQKHWVVATFDYVNKTAASNNAYFAAAVLSGSNWQDEFITGSTTTVISQPFGTTEYNLFGVGNKFAGNSANTEFKISITNIKKSSNPTADEYGTFTLLVRKFDDNDKNPVVLESFSNLSLNPDSPNYIARRIGDIYQVWNKTTKKFDEFGEFDSKSNYIFVTPSLDVKNKNVPATALPYGFGGYRVVGSSSISNKALFPDVPFVNNLLYKGDFSSKVYWGVSVIDNASGAINYGLPDKLAHVGKNLTNNFSYTGAKFSLKWLSSSMLSTLVGYGSTTRLTEIQLGSLTSSVLYNTGTTNPTAGSTSGYLSIDNIENTSLAKFTLPMNDGYDGVDVTKANVFDPSNMTSLTAYETYAYRTALDMLSNSDLIEFTDMSLPGVWASKVTDYAIDMVENRGDVFYIMDVSGSSVSDVIDNLSTRLIDTNYAATYYPWVRMLDRVNNKQVEVPPSVILPAVFAYNDSVAFAWYAPAGMNRGALSRHGVIKAKDKLTKVERDRLYENRINPIASFPDSGPVVWGQKTLQIAASALDRVNVRRMLLSTRKLIAKKAISVVFEPNVPAVWQRFVNSVEPDLKRIQQNFGISEFKLILDERTTTEDLIERNIMYGKIAIKPTRAAEFILLDFFVTNSVAGFAE